jgi:lysophospholipase L1-like esterase
MRLRLLSVTILVSVLGTGLASADPEYYLALGDSLSVGIQPSRTGADVRTSQGYVDDLFAFYRTRVPGLQLKKLGCSGETTATMLTGGVCTYPDAPSQLAAAIAFIATHRVRFITIDIGANNIDGCIDLTTSPPTIDQSCVLIGILQAQQQVPMILAALRGAAPEVRIFAINYYDPLVALSIFGQVGVQLAQESLQGTLALNGVLAAAYGAADVAVADVARTFRITDFTPVPLLGIPLNALLALSWTWMGARPPVGPNVHPNALGYAVIAGTLVQAIGQP